MARYLIIIPTLEPSDDFIDYCQTLCQYDLGDVLIVNDGSSERTQWIFDQLDENPAITVLHHHKNRGKGRALKTAFQYFLAHAETNHWNGLVTVDSDGQHTIQDVKKIIQMLNNTTDAIVLGSRCFDETNVPLKSQFGNKLTTLLFKLLYGQSVQDTQTGLRGIHTQVVPAFMNLSGERFEFEMRMLTEAIKQQIKVVEVPIETVYIDENSGTHFRPIKDSIEIYAVLFSTISFFIFISLVSFIIDIAVFKGVITVLSETGLASRILIATIIARVLSSIFNFLCNHFFVFASRTSLTNNMLKYYGLVIVQLLLSALLVYLGHQWIGFSETGTKVIVDIVLFLISYQVQARVIFR